MLSTTTATATATTTTTILQPPGLSGTTLVSRYRKAKTR